MNDSFFCFFVDHTFFNPLEIGRLYLSHLKMMSNSDQKKYAILSTCQRIEIYSTENHNFLAHLNIPFQQIQGIKNIFNRLTAISSGIYSQILGEKNIVAQMKIVRDALSHENPFKNIFSSALEKGDFYRKKHHFGSALDYEEIAVSLINDKQPLHSEHRELVIIGSGMLAKGFIAANNVSQLYEKLYFVTRAYKSLKKILRNDKKSDVGSVNNIQEKLKHPYHCIIATTNMTEEYKNTLFPLLKMANCRAVFDFSAVPTFDCLEQMDIFYSNSYKTDYLDHVRFLNQDLIYVAKKIKTEINNSMEEALI